jgi:hypothetical protein
MSTGKNRRIGLSKEAVMHRKLVVCLLALVAMSLVPAPQVTAKPNEPAVLFTDLSYTPMAPMETKIKGTVFYARGTGTVDCNGVEACETAGLDGQTAVIRQVFGLKADIDSDGNGLATAGYLELGGDSTPIAFKGKGTGTLTCAAETCNLAIELATRTERGKLTFFLLILDIDHSSAGIVYDSMEGTAQYTPR